MFNFLYNKEYVKAQVVRKHEETQCMITPTIYGFTTSSEERKCFLTLKASNAELIEPVTNCDYHCVVVGQKVTIEKLRSVFSKRVHKINVLLQE